MEETYRHTHIEDCSDQHICSIITVLHSIAVHVLHTHVYMLMMHVQQSTANNASGWLFDLFSYS